MNNFHLLQRFLLGFSLTIFAAGWFAGASTSNVARDSSDNTDKTEEQYTGLNKFLRSIDTELGGHVKLRSNLSWPADDSIFQFVGVRTFWEGSAETRLINTLYFSSRWRLDTHYEAILTGGDTCRKSFALIQMYPSLEPLAQTFFQFPDDRRRLMDLTAVISSSNDYNLYHRLDRLAVTYAPTWGSISVGRQAVTWGNGMVFNPMDLFNPFAPTDVERDYKLGDDLFLSQVNINGGDLQLLAVPRRNPQTGSIRMDQSSLAAKWRLPLGGADLDLMGSKHYQDSVFGAGLSGYLGQAAWRLDTTLTRLEENRTPTNYFSVVANLDYSWVINGDNFYGFAEFYFNGLGSSDYLVQLTNPAVVERLERGELFTLGRYYLAGTFQWEIHPLANFFVTGIVNLQDPSGIIQPRLTWDMADNVQLLVGGNISVGPEGSEFGGLLIPETDIVLKNAPSLYFWLAWYY